MHPTTPTRILVVDDEASIVDSVSTVLRYEGYDVSVATSGRTALQAITADPPDLVVLDVMLPDLSGIDLTRHIRSAGIDVPVLFLSARDGLDDKVAGLSVGGDDYVTKPFALSEILARVQAILRRSGKANDPDQHLLSFADVTLNEQTHEVHRSGTEIELTATEFSLLRYFLLNPRRVLSKAQILDHVWHYDFGGDANVVETYVSYLRRKLDQRGPSLIKTIRLVGYILREPTES